MPSDAAAYIQSFRYKGSRPGLSRISELLTRLGDPQDQLHFIHVAGTNGKGSVCSMLASVLEKAGYKTGLFTSPYIYRLQEYFKVDGREIADDALNALVNEVRPHVDQMADKPTEFELITALVIYYFYKQDCRLVVLETGLGGRQDATNIIPAPLVAAITSIGLEHMEYLGNTLTGIAAEKAGIIKNGSLVVLCRQTETVMGVIRAKCTEVQAPLFITEHPRATALDVGLKYQSFDYRRRTSLQLHLLGSEQLKNAAVTLDIIDCLKSLEYELSEQAISEGLQDTVWPGRFEILQQEPGVILDGAHNPDGAAVFISNLKSYFPKQKFIFVIGVMKDKKYNKILELAAPLAQEFITVTPDSERALSSAELKAAIAAVFDGQIYDAGSVGKAIAYISEYQGPGQIACIFGTLYMLKEIKEEWQRQISEGIVPQCES